MSAKAVGIFQTLQLSGDEPYLNPAERICSRELIEDVYVVADGPGPVAGYALDQTALGADRMLLEAPIHSSVLKGEPGNFSIAFMLTGQLFNTRRHNEFL